MALQKQFFLFIVALLCRIRSRIANATKHFDTQFYSVGVEIKGGLHALESIANNAKVHQRE